ncbi:MAG: hypothetical protein E7502_09375 [Ruminococcus sp.]|nr:hypothetical protein [Ruminococcus sp.]
MGLFDRWKKKPQDDEPCESILDASVQEEETPPVQEEANPAPQPETAQVPDVHAMLAQIKEIFPTAQWQGETSLHFPCGLDLTIRGGSAEQYPKGFCSQLLFVMWHPYFDEDLIESVAGMGETEAQARRNGVESFCAGVLQYVLAALEGSGNDKITTELQGTVHSFHEPAAIGILHRGEGEPANLWKLLHAQIPQYLGTKKAYWIKLFVSRRGKDICEARINGKVYRELTDMLYKLAVQENAAAEGCMDKCFVLLIQDEETYTPCPFKKADAAAVAQKALHKMLTIEDEESHAAVYEEIQQLHPILGGEACAFLPEIFTRILFPYRPSDALLPLSLQIGEVRCSQVRSFGYFESAVLDFLRQYRPNGDDRVKILRLGAEFSALNQALSDGSKMEDLQFSPLAYVTPEDYVIW